jgi:hypothetical protein
MRYAFWSGLMGITLLATAGIVVVRYGGIAHVLDAAHTRLAEWTDPSTLTPWPQRHVPPLPADAIPTMAAITWQHTIDRRGPALYPSPSYGGVYLRDTFWATGALPDAALSLALRRQFERFQRPDGQLPSRFAAWQRGPAYDADESTSLYVLWNCRDRARFGTPVTTRPLGRALAYLRHTAVGGYTISPPGDRRSWLDTLKLAHPDTLSYNQGLYAVALACARGLGFPVSAVEVATAARAYRALYQPTLGYLPLGRHLPDRDVSSLTGDFVALWLLGHPLLTDTIVRSTVAHFAIAATGYKVITQPDGSYLPVDQFSVPGPAGYYQNGGAWELFDALALGTAARHGWRPARALLQQRLALDAATGRLFEEFSCTNPALPCFLYPVPAHRYTAWNTFVSVVERVVTRPSARP